jgi:UDP-glucuronate decarboxylase
MAIGDGRVVSNFIVQALRGEPLTIYGDGSQTRSFCYVDDLVNGITKMALADSNYDQPINLGNPNEFSMIQLAQTVIEVTESKSKINFLPLPEDDPKQRRPDISSANRFLDWKPNIELIEGIKLTAAYFRTLV